jgi:hypothetical protein
VYGYIGAPLQGKFFQKAVSAVDEGVPNGPSIFAYLVFRPGRASVEGITRPIH